MAPIAANEDQLKTLYLINAVQIFFFLFEVCVDIVCRATLCIENHGTKSDQ